MYAAWQCLRSFLHRGWWLVTSLYLVTEAELTPLQLVALGTGQGLVVLAAEIPTGVFADTVSRKWSIVLSHVLMGAGMASTGLTDSFALLLLTQMLWGLSWTFSTGADVAWLTDEIGAPTETAVALADAGKWAYVGSALGMAAFAGLAWRTSLSTAIVTAGLAMWLLGIWVAVAFPETWTRNPSSDRGVRAALRILADGVHSVRLQRTLMLIMVCTILVNGADEAFGRLYAKRLVDLGLPDSAEPIVWLSLIAIAALLLGAVSLALLTKRLAGAPIFARAYALAALIGAGGLLLFAAAPDAEFALLGVLIVSGIATTILRTVSVIWSNEHATSDVRATVQSLLSLSEHGGEITIGLALAFLAQLLGISWAMMVSCMIFIVVAGLARGHQRRN